MGEKGEDAEAAKLEQVDPQLHPKYEDMAPYGNSYRKAKSI